MNGRLVQLLAVASFSSLAVFGGTIQVTLVSGAGTNSGPYVADVGALNNVDVVCDDYYDKVQVGEVWNADIETLSQVISDGDSATPSGGVTPTRFTAPTYSTTLYEQAAYLALQLLGANSANAPAIQTAIWSLFDSGAPTVAGSGSSSPTSTAYWLKQVSTTGSNWASDLALVTKLGSEIEFLTPTSIVKNGVTGSNPQEFIYVVTPEPATYAMFGMGLILLSLGTFRRTSKKTK